MPADSETFSNPVAPASHRNLAEEDEHKLTNDDFRTLLMTPRVQPKVPPPKQRPGINKDYSDADDAFSKRRKKKLYYAKLKQQEEERQKELASKYRDRATERREGKNQDYQHNDAPDLGKTAEYRAVAPTTDQVNTAAERRRLAIQESKFLGGDMEHTHLVKGLDFALLQKVRSEIAINETEEKDEAEPKPKDNKKKEQKDEVVPDIEFVSVLGRKIHKAAMNTKPSLRNDLFLPGRMAYVFNLDEEYDETDIPTTTIRSKADCPLIENQTTLTTNDIVINKLTQILSYLRQGVRASKKLKKREKELIRAGKDPRIEDSIFGDVGEHNAGLTSYGKDHSDKNQYFGNNTDYDMQNKEFNKYDTTVKDFVKNVNERFGQSKNSDSGWKEISSVATSKKSKSKVREAEMDSYAECYPGAAEMDDAVNDSDDDADYSKMDMGNKKGPIKRWDFDNEEEYNKYMENREAMPKAAFQFGIKMGAGRKTRSKPGQMSEKQKLDREWQQISSLIAKRKSDGGRPSGGKKSRDY